ncbi:histidinol dehydrogenase [Crocinitomix algicola]|uniref:histidinol dehydrogenase n=1 Tax=Crocinitomix algicola TaxID=1740263 RepID=UPI000832AA93|nr:histidinol dehydrogenase [Crocinitomix algicola]
MKTILYPNIDEWKSLSNRPTISDDLLAPKVLKILKDVKTNGDAAINFYNQKFDNFNDVNFEVTAEEVELAAQFIPQKLKDAIELAYENIYAFHHIQKKKEVRISPKPGVTCWQKATAIEKVGLYIPGGSAPLFSTILMLGIPAKIAGCKEIILCTPANEFGKINPTILYAARRVGITKIYKIGGAQAIAAMAYGTLQVDKVSKIFGPGNQYVTKAKEQVQMDGTAIDMPAGPSELLIIADETCNPKFVAADLLSQAEHGADSQVILLSPLQTIVERCLKEINLQISELPRQNTAKLALSNSKAIVLENLKDCFKFSNNYAPEHLIIACKNAEMLAETVITAGSVFIGNYSCESAGDYASGTNHTLPTNGYAASYSGVSVDSFVKQITFQKISPAGLQTIGPAIETMAEAEGLTGHKNAVTIRLNTLDI